MAARPTRAGRRPRSTRVPIATGEHVYTRWQTKELLVAGAQAQAQGRDRAGNHLRTCAQLQLFALTLRGRASRHDGSI